MEEELHKKQEEGKNLGQHKLLATIFYYGALESPQNLHATFRKYKLWFLKTLANCLFCFFVEPMFQFIKM